MTCQSRSKRIDEKLERRGHVHPAVQQKKLRRVGLAPRSHVVAQAANGVEMGLAGFHGSCNGQAVNRAACNRCIDRRDRQGPPTPKRACSQAAMVAPRSDHSTPIRERGVIAAVRARCGSRKMRAMSDPSFVHLRLHSEYSDRRRHRAHRRRRRRGRRRRDAGARAHRSRQPVRPGQVLQGGARARREADRRLRRAGSPTRPIATSRIALLLLCQNRAGYLRLCDWLTRAYRAQSAIAAAPSCAERGSTRRHRRPDRAVGRAPTATSGRRCSPDNADGARDARRANGRRCFPDRYYIELQRVGGAVTRRRRCRSNARAARGRRSPPSSALPVVATHPVQFVTPRRLPRARSARVHLRRLRSSSDQRRPRRFTPRAVLQDAGRDGGALRRLSRGARQRGRDRASAAT